MLLEFWGASPLIPSLLKNPVVIMRFMRYKSLVYSHLEFWLAISGMGSFFFPCILHVRLFLHFSSADHAENKGGAKVQVPSKIKPRTGHPFLLL